jgi:hypothetical protein
MAMTTLKPHEFQRGIRRLARHKVYLSLEQEYLSEGRAIQTDFTPTRKMYLKILAAIAIGGATGIFTVTAIYLVYVWLLHLQLF